MKILEGSVQELIAYAEWHEARAKASEIDDLPNIKQISIPPTRCPPKDRTAKLEAIFRDYLKAGLNAKAIQAHLASEHNIQMNGHQVCGWIGRMKQLAEKPPEISKKADKTNLEGNCSGQGEKAAKEPTENPANVIGVGVRSTPDKKKVDEHILRWHYAGDLDIDISQRLRRADVNMTPVEVAKRIKELKG